MVVDGSTGSAAAVFEDDSSDPVDGVPDESSDYASISIRELPASANTRRLFDTGSGLAILERLVLPT